VRSSARFRVSGRYRPHPPEVEGVTQEVFLVFATNFGEVFRPGGKFGGAAFEASPHPGEEAGAVVHGFVIRQ